MGQHAGEPANPVSQSISQAKILTFRQGKEEKNSAQWQWDMHAVNRFDLHLHFPNYSKVFKGVVLHKEKWL